MNILRKALASEAAILKPLLDRTYNAILRYQESRTPANEARLREAMAPTVAQLMVFKVYMPTYKQEYFDVLDAEWPSMAPGDLIMLFDHCVSIMHLRLSRIRSENGGPPRRWARPRASSCAAASQRRPGSGPASPGW